MSTPPEIATFASKLAQSLCSGFRDCCVRDGYRFGDVACASSITGLYDTYTKLSCVTFDATQAQACHDELTTLSSKCPATREDRNRFSSACESVVKGTQPIGASCVTSLDCAAPGHATPVCVQELNGAATCHQDVWHAQGDACDPVASPLAALCDPLAQLYCDGSKRCRAMGGPGAACTPTFTNYLFACLDGAYCAQADDTCHATLTAGAACSDWEACGAGAQCHASTSAV